MGTVVVGVSIGKLEAFDKFTKNIPRLSNCENALHPFANLTTRNRQSKGVRNVCEIAIQYNTVVIIIKKGVKVDFDEVGRKTPRISIFETALQPSVNMTTLNRDGDKVRNTGQIARPREDEVRIIRKGVIVVFDEDGMKTRR